MLFGGCLTLYGNLSILNNKNFFMEQEKFKITEFEQRRLIIDLLVRVTTENSIMRHYILLLMTKEDPKYFAKMQDAFQEQYQSRGRKLKETIFENYGHVDLDDILPNIDK